MKRKQDRERGRECDEEASDLISSLACMAGIALKHLKTSHSMNDLFYQKFTLLKRHSDMHLFDCLVFKLISADVPSP